jgi:L-lactate utilization protein LutB
MDLCIDHLIKNWQKRNIAGFFCATKEEAAQKLLEMIPQGCSVGISGSVTLAQLGIVKQLEARGGNTVFNQYLPGISRQENLDIRRKGAAADFFLASANAISQSGELVFFSGWGNRTAGISSAANVLLVCGVNKITPNLEEALKRAREYATPLNSKRLSSWNTACFQDGICRSQICFAPQYTRMCCQILVIESEAAADRLKVILVGENLGY